MEPTILTALITAGATLASAIIGARAIMQKERKKNKELSTELDQLRRSGYRLPMLTPEEYGIDIVTPAEYTRSGNAFTVSGIYKVLPEGQHIWTSTFKVGDNGNILEYWPQGLAKASKGKWYGHIHNISGEPGDAKEFLVLVVGIDGNALFHHFSKVGAATGSWPGISELTSDIVVCKKWSIKI